MTLTDMHTHTLYSFDGQHSPQEICESAFQKGISYFALTDHYDYDSRGGHDIFDNGIEQRFRQIAEAKRLYDGRMCVLCGIELGQPYLEPDNAHRLAADPRFDVVIGAVHDLRDNVSIYACSPRSLAEQDAFFEQYYAETAELLRDPFFDILAHIEYPMRVMRQCFPDGTLRRYESLILPLVKQIADSGVSLEINTNGVRNWQRRPDPELWVLEAYKKCDGERVSIGSDGHTPGSVGTGIIEANQLALDAGFDKVVVFQNRKAEYIPIK